MIQDRDLFRAANDLGVVLEPDDIVWEVVPTETIYRIAAYGFPRNFHHWSRGRTYWRMKSEHDKGHGKIYELVLNDRPAVAYISEDNTDFERAFVKAHVIGHVYAMRHNRINLEYMPSGMIARARSARERFLAYEQDYGLRPVEDAIDLALALFPFVRRTMSWRELFTPDRFVLGARLRPQSDDPLTADLRQKRLAEEEDRLLTDLGRYIQGLDEQDLLLWLSVYPELPDYLKDIFTTVRQQHLYHQGILFTKILHEGFASYVHKRIFEALHIDAADVFRFAHLHALLATPNALAFNPYHLGMRLFEALAERGVDVLQVVADESDLSLFANYLDEDLIRELGLYQWEVDWDTVLNTPYGPRHPVLHRATRRWQDLKQQIIRSLQKVYPMPLRILSHNLPVRPVPSDVLRVAASERWLGARQATHNGEAEELIRQLKTLKDAEGYYRTLEKASRYIVFEVPIASEDMDLYVERQDDAAPVTDRLGFVYRDFVERVLGWFSLYLQDPQGPTYALLLLTRDGKLQNAYGVAG